MTILIDRKYLMIISNKLPKFHQKKQDLYNFRCPICHDSEKNKNKCRGYIYRKKDNYFYSCHNCGLSTNFYGFLEKVDPLLLSEYSLDNFRDRDTTNSTVRIMDESTLDMDKIKSQPMFKTKNMGLESIDSLSDNHVAKQYCLDRKIPKKKLCNLWYAPDFKSFVDSLGVENNLSVYEDRLIIPFLDEKKQLVCLQGRTLSGSSIRYITIKMQKDSPKIFGMNGIDKEEFIYVVEGPLDSLFLNNCVATADSNLASITNILSKNRVILVYDNEPRNKEICRLMEKAIDEHYQVVIWPEFIKNKDINEMVLDGFSIEEIQDIIEKNTFVNLRAKIEFINWKKI